MGHWLGLNIRQKTCSDCGWTRLLPRRWFLSATQNALVHPKTDRMRLVNPSIRIASVAAVSLLPPRVAIQVITVHFPEAWFVVSHEPQTAHPFSALPEVQVRHQKTGRTAVFRLEGRAIEREGDPRFSTSDVFERQVGRVTTIGERHNELS